MIELDSNNNATYFHEVWWKGCSFGLHSSTRSVCSLLEGDLEMTTDDHSDGVGAVDANTDSAAGEDPSLKVLTGGASGVETVRNSNGATAGDPEAVTSINANPWPAANGETRLADTPTIYTKMALTQLRGDCSWR